MDWYNKASRFLEAGMYVRILEPLFNEWDDNVTVVYPAGIVTSMPDKTAKELIAANQAERVTTFTDKQRILDYEL